MNFFDLHCDTLYKVVCEDKSLIQNDCDVSLEKAKIFDKYIQCFAVWIPDDVRKSKAMELFEKCRKKLSQEFVSFGETGSIVDNNFSEKKIQAILTVEGSAVLGGKIENIKYLKKCGVKVITLTWNGSCEVGDGCAVHNALGLSDFGKSVVQSMDKYGIVIDVSHASEKLFYNVACNSSKPFIATHSNSFEICNHYRNLKDEQFQIIKQCGGLVGITFFDEFLGLEKYHSGFDKIRAHVEHFLELGGEKTLSIGSDFDGANMIEEIKSIEKIKYLYEFFLKKNYKEKVVKDIFFDNAYNFFKNKIEF